MKGIQEIDLSCANGRFADQIQKVVLNAAIELLLFRCSAIHRNDHLFAE